MPYLASFSRPSRVVGSDRRPWTLLFFALAMVFLAGPGATPDARAGQLIAPVKVCPDRNADRGGAAMSKARRSMTCMVNYARRKRSLPGYRTDRNLTWSAGKKAADIRRCDFSHSACERPFTFWIHRSGYTRSAGWKAGENIAWGSGSLGSVRSIFIAWMKSSGHRAAILSRDYRDFGVGVVKGRFKGVPGARIWVLHFGAH